MHRIALFSGPFSAFRYHIVGIFEGENLLVGKLGFCGENFRGLLACTAHCQLSLQTIIEKTFADRYKTAIFAKVFSLESFPLYSIRR